MTRLVRLFAASLLGHCAGNAVAQGPREEIEASLARTSSAWWSFTVEYEVRRSTPLAPDDLYSRWAVGPALLAPVDDRIVAKGASLAVISSFPSDEPGASWRWDAREVVFDGRTIFFSDHPMRCSIYDASTVGAHINPQTVLFRSPYFDALRIRLAATPGELGSLPHSEILADLAAGAGVVCEHGTEGSLWRVEASTADEQRVTWLDPRRGWAVVAFERRRDGKPVRRVTNQDFQVFGESWVPKHCRNEWYSWHTVRELPSDQPLLVEDVRLVRIEAIANATHLRPRERRPGGQVLDARGSSNMAGTSDADFSVYDVPFTEHALLQAFSACRSGRWDGASDHALLRWIAVHAGGLVAVLLWLWRRQ